MTERRIQFNRRRMLALGAAAHRLAARADRAPLSP